MRAPALPLALIHRSAWKGNSPNFAITEFSEVGSQEVAARQHIIQSIYT